MNALIKLRREFRPGVACLFVASVICAPAYGLVTFNDGHDHIYVTGTIGVSHDSNIFASNRSAGDTVYNASVLAEYARHAGWIAVNASFQVETTHFAQHNSEDSTNPKFDLELMKQTGRTTGSLTLNLARENRVDPNVNLRDESWVYGAGLMAKYPIIERYAISGSLGYSLVDYTDNRLYVDQKSYTAAADLFYALSQERDLLAGYRYRDNESSVNTASTDHAAFIGISGRLIRGINGSLRVGYQTRIPKNSSDSAFNGWTGSATVAHPFTKKFSMNGSIQEDFSNTATNINIDAATASLDAQYAFNSRWSANAGASYGHTRFLGVAGIDVASGRRRIDTILGASVGLGYSLNEHFKVSLNCTWSENWSTIGFSDFIRQGWSLNLSSRW